jgi:hypothetical protein
MPETGLIASLLTTRYTAPYLKVAVNDCVPFRIQ